MREELCVADDCSLSGTVAKVLGQNGHIAAATNSALALAIGEFVALMDHDDLLSEHALYEVAAELNAHPDADIVFSEEDQLDATGHRFQPDFKSDWNIELMLGHNMVSHLGVFRRALVEQVGNMRLGFEGSQDYDLTLRAAAATEAGRIRHIPAVLYHWRQHPSFSKAREAACVDSARCAIGDFLVNQGIADAEVVPAPAVPTWTRVRWPMPDPVPRVSVIIPTRDRADLLRRCTSAVLLRTDYPDLELLIADNDTSDPEAHAPLGELAGDPRVRVIPCPGPFNYPAVNNAAAKLASGEILLLLNNDIDVIRDDWLREMVSLAVRPSIGAVGARLLYGNDTIQYAGVVLGSGSFCGGPGVAGHFGLGLPARDVGYLGLLSLTREAAAVTGACLAVRKSAYEGIGGLDETNLFAELYHLESASRGNDLDPDKVERCTREAQYMRDRWGSVLDTDPFYKRQFLSRRPHLPPGYPAAARKAMAAAVLIRRPSCPPEPRPC